MPKRSRDGEVVASAAVKVAKQFWLMKSEPDVFSLADLKKKNVEKWDGVRNYQARNNMRAMKVGDSVLFYHSNAKPSGIVGTATIAREAYPDYTAWEKGAKYFDARSTKDKPVWDMVDVQYESTFPRTISLEECKSDSKLSNMDLVKFGRLSVQKVTETEFRYVVDVLSKKKSS